MSGQRGHLAEGRFEATRFVEQWSPTFHPHEFLLDPVKVLEEST